MPRTKDTIDRSPEYLQFIRDLEEFHQRHGTTLQAEPILGGQKLDLLKLYKEVTAAGGYQQVTQDRIWKLLGESFEFKSTCTNSAYVLKSVYKKNLLGWEKTKMWGLQWNPSMADEPKSASKTSTKTKDRARQPYTIPKQKDRKKIPKGSASDPNPSETTILPITAIRRPTAFLSDKDACNLSSAENIDNLDAFLSQLSSMLEAAGQPRTAEKLVSRTQSNLDKVGNSKEQLSMICNMLVSRKPADVQSAMVYLLKLSFELPENITKDYLAAIIHALIPFAQPVFSDPKLRPGQSDLMDTDFDAMDTSEGTESNTTPVDLGLAFDAFRILRNLSFVESDAEFMASNTIIRNMVLAGLMLPTNTKYVELTQHSLDILDNISSHVKSPEGDDYVANLLKLLFSNDREIIIGVLKALTYLAIQKTDHYPFLADHTEHVKRLIQLLLIDDEDLVTRTLEFFYVYTSAWPDFTTQLLHMYPGNGISLLTSFLTYDSSKPAYANQAASPSSDLSDTTDLCQDRSCSIPSLTHYQDMDEPYRCLGWLKQKFEIANLECNLSLCDLYLLYETRFGMERPLDLDKFLVVFKIAYPELTMSGGEVSTTPPEQIIIHGIQIKMNILEDADEFACKWSNCAQTFSDELHLQHHVFNEHIPPCPRNEPYQCHWMECSDIPDGESNSRDSIASHLGTHFFEHLCEHYHGHEHHGIPLATALLLHNFARQKGNSPYFEPYTNHLKGMMDNKPHLAGIIQNILHELEA
ncbi:hypothetical protein BGW37DRAFT_507757 [Umbelopsis sp. PMI_123]|nr:hypothetical protein BGW37DRAFT_507757 [Umbelopsis sp. PMI_123]